ncbi:MAG: cupin domain-containing protein [Caldilineaceae bacterium]
MIAFEYPQIAKERADSGSMWLEFFQASSKSLSMGLYVIPAGGVDPQSPHTEDEIYYVVSGRGKIQVKEEDRTVQAGSIIYVAANDEHRFHNVEEELSLIVFFAPAEYTKQ